MIVSTKELSDALRLTPRRIQDLENEGVISKISRNEWDLSECIDGYLDYKIKSITQKYELSEARAKKELAEAELKQMLLAEKKGEVIAIERLEKDLSDIASTLSNRLYALPLKIKRVVSLSDEVQEAIIKEIEATLNELKETSIYKNYGS